MDPVRAQRLWGARSWRSDLLLPVAWLFGAISTLRRQIYRSGLVATRHLPVPVIVVGNIVVGGTGKTPLVIALVEFLKNAGYHPGVVSRGYGGSVSKHGALALVTRADAAAFGDEIVLISKATGVPCAVGARRFEAAQLLLRRHTEIDVILSDDGLQHYALAREVALAVFDGRGIGNGRLLPAGPLRESASQLAGTSAVIFNDDRADLKPAWLKVEVPTFRMRVTATGCWQLIAPGQTMAFKDLKQLADSFAPKQVLALAGIGHPERFFGMLDTHGLACTGKALPDHFAFPDNFFAGMDAKLILITEKDAVKCSTVDDPRIWVIPVAAELDPTLTQLVLEKLVAPS